MSSSERSPKRQRTSYSPASPPMPEAKSFTDGQSLHTPPPSVHMSPSWYAQPLPANGVAASTMPTPPSISSFPSQAVARSTDGGDSFVGTPAGKERDEEEDVEMGEVDHRRSDHDRLQAEDIPPPSLFHFAAEPVDPRRPDPALDMFELYSLKSIQASVARRDPETGEKINKLRKSYETKARNLGIEGRNKALVQEGHLTGFVDPAWDMQINAEQTLWQQKMESMIIGGPSTDELFRALPRALSMRSGNLPKHEHAELVQQLGLDEPPAPQQPPPQGQRPSLGPVAAKSTNNLLLAKTAPLAAGRATAPSSPSTALRPDRAGKKRRYDESSYEGYDDDGYSTGGVDDTGKRINGAKRVKRKDIPMTGSSPSFAGSSGGAVGLVGIRGQ